MIFVDNLYYIRNGMINFINLNYILQLCLTCQLFININHYQHHYLLHLFLSTFIIYINWSERRKKYVIFVRKLKFYGGNYDTFMRTRMELEESQMKQYQWEQDQISHMKVRKYKITNGGFNNQKEL